MLGRVLLIANPTAQNSAAGEAIDVAAGLVSVLPGCESLEVATTNAPGHAKDIASKAQGFDTFVALGGDGLVHEVCNGIMMRDDVAVRSDAARIQMGLIPFGSGNDYARTLGMSTDLKTAAVQLAEARPAMLDVGVCNGEYFCCILQAESISCFIISISILQRFASTICRPKPSTCICLPSRSAKLMGEVSRFAPKPMLKTAFSTSASPVRLWPWLKPALRSPLRKTVITPSGRRSSFIVRRRSLFRSKRAFRFKLMEKRWRRSCSTSRASVNPCAFFALRRRAREACTPGTHPFKTPS